MADDAGTAARALLQSLAWRDAPVAESGLESGPEWGAYQGLPPQVELLDDGRRARLLSPLSYRGPDQADWPVPAGVLVDGASIPQILWTLIGGPFAGRYRNASIVHDHFCVTRTRPWAETHRMFYTAMRCSGVDPAKARIMYYAVYRFGPRWAAPGEEGMGLAPGIRDLPVPGLAELAADAAAIQVHGLELGEIEALADAREAWWNGLAAPPATVPADRRQRARLLVVTGGTAGAEDLDAVAGEVEKLPDFVLGRFERRNIRVVACREGVTDFEASLRGVVPRGWEGTGRTWDDVPGAYFGQSKRAVIATVAQDGRRVVPTSATGRHGSASLTVHECLHGYDYSGGHAAIADDRFLRARTDDLDRLDPYEQQAGQAGLEETFAESGARYFVVPAQMQASWPHLFVFWRDAAGSLPEAPMAAPAVAAGPAGMLGMAVLEADGIVLELRAEGPGDAVGHARLTVGPEDPAHAALLGELFEAGRGPEAPMPRRVPFRPQRG